jgi:hypothetical protein
LEAINEYRAVIKLNPEDPTGYNTLARVLAMNPDRACRDGVEAVRLAEMACRMTQYKSPVALDTAAASYAEAGRFKEAVQAAQSARDLALASGEKQLVTEIDTRLKSYMVKHPVREYPVRD